MAGKAVALAQVGGVLHDLQVMGDVQTADQSAAKRDDVVDVMLDAGRRGNHRRLVVDRFDGLSIGPFERRVEFRGMPFTAQGSYSAGVGFCPSPVRGFQVLGVLAAPFSVLLSQVVAVLSVPFLERGRILSAPLFRPFNGALSARVAQAIFGSGAFRKPLLWLGHLAHAASFESVVGKPLQHGSTGRRLRVVGMGATRPAPRLNAKSPTSRPDTTSPRVLIEVDKRFRLQAFAADLVGDVVHLTDRLPVRLSVLGRVLAQLFLMPFSVVLLYLKAPLSGHFRGPSMWASMMRLTSSAMEMPSRLASLIRKARCGVVNEIICLIIETQPFSGTTSCKRASGSDENRSVGFSRTEILGMFSHILALRILLPADAAGRTKGNSSTALRCIHMSIAASLALIPMIPQGISVGAS